LTFIFNSADVLHILTRYGVFMFFVCMSYVT